MSRLIAVFAAMTLAVTIAALDARAEDPPLQIDIDQIEELPDVPGIDPNNKLRRLKRPMSKANPVDEKAAGQAVGGLKVTLSAEPTTLKTEQLNLRRALADTPHFSVEPTQLTITFENVSDKPIKLDLYAVTAMAKLDVQVTGSGDDSVKTQIMGMNYMLAAPRPEDYPTLAPGKSRTLSFKPRFPGLFGRTKYTLLAEGQYKLAAVYKVADRPQQRGQDFQKGVWTGQAVSNAVELTVGEPEPAWGKPVKGLRLGVALPKLRYEVGQSVNATVHLQNTTEKKLQTIPLRMAGTYDLMVTGPDSNRVRYAGPSIDIELPPVALDPGESLSDTVPLANFNLDKPGKYTVQAVRSEGGTRMESGKLTFEVVKPGADDGDGLTFGPPINGLRLALSPEATKIEPGHPLKVEMVFENASDKPLRLMQAFMVGAGLNVELVGPDGKKLPYRGLTANLVPDWDKGVIELAPGKRLNRDVSLFGYDMRKPGEYKLTVSYSWTLAREPGGNAAGGKRGDVWTGAVTAASLTLTVAE